MKTTQLRNSPRNGNAKRPAHPAAPGLADDRILLSPPRTDRTRIQWPTERQLQEVSTKLLRISRAGQRSEIAGDYFKSGDLAFQLHDILRVTDDLIKKSQRG